MTYQIWLPPSEGKTPPQNGDPLNLDGLFFAEQLRDAREKVLRILTEVSAGPEAAKILKLGAKADQMLESNRDLLHAPAAPAYEVYTGVLWEAAEVGRFPAWHQDVLVFSGLFGVLRASDSIPDHRLSMGVKLPEVGGLAAFWKKQFPEPHVPVVDLRSGTYSSALPSAPGSLAVNVKTADGKVVSHWAKHWRGCLARELMNQDVRDLAEVPDCARSLEGVDHVEVNWEEKQLTLHLA